MENKINIAKLLKDCPKGMELDCTMYEDVYFENISDCGQFIYCYINYEDRKTSTCFNKYGTYSNLDKSKCVIFPKGRTTWEGFVPPCKFKDGDVIFTHANCLKVGLGNSWISIFQEKRNGGVATYVDMSEGGKDYYDYIIDDDKALLCMDKDIMCQRLATEEEKQKLFDAIKDNGYKWNPETKTLEKLIEPKFKVGDKIRRKADPIFVFNITNITKDKYECGKSFVLRFANQDEYELVPNKFDINTLKPFEDKVLVRNDESQRWLPAFWGYKVVDGFITTFGWCKYCIPYEGNEFLFKTNNDCDDYFKTWEK